MQIFVEQLSPKCGIKVKAALKFCKTCVAMKFVDDDDDDEVVRETDSGDNEDKMNNN